MRAELSKISRYPDLDIDKILRAISLARGQMPKDSSYEDVVARSIANLSGGASSFERGVVGGLVFSQMKRDR